MLNLETLTVRFEADAKGLFDSLDLMETRLEALRDQSASPLPTALDMQAKLTVTADEAITNALSGAGEMLSEAVRSHEIDLASAMSDAQSAMANALQAAVDKLSASIQLTIPVSVDGYRLGVATLNGIKKRSLAQGNYTAY